MYKYLRLTLLSPFALLARTILFLMGWKLLDWLTLERLLERKRCVLVFSHTSYADFFLLTLYMISYPNDLDKIRILITPRMFEYYGLNWFLKQLGGIPAPKFDERGGNSVARIVAELNSVKHCMFLISPKGTIVKAPWRSGYYHIAKGIKADLRVAGLDYEQKHICVYSAVSYLKDQKVIEYVLKDHLGSIVPLNPEDETVEIRRHDKDKVGIVDWQRLGTIIAILLLFYYVGDIYVMLLALMLWLGAEQV